MARTTSIVTVCMNRREHLLQTAPRVAAWPHHDEHLIVDWSSREHLRYEDLPEDPRVRLVRVEQERGWNLCRAYNFGLARARGSCLFKLDADCWPLDLGAPDRMASEEPFCLFGTGPDGRLGQWIMDRSLLERVGGFNELLWGYGFDDKDLKARLRQLQTPPVLRELPEEALGVIRHSSHYRASRDSPAAGRLSRLEEQRSDALKKATSLANRVTAAHCPWHAGAAATRYRQLNEDLWEAEAGTVPEPPPPVRKELDKLRRIVFWGRFLAIPEIYVERLPEKLLPGGGPAGFLLAPWHRAYWHTVRRLTDVPVALLSLLRGSLQRRGPRHG
jgi:hypothetical protein